jgi:hypothetical protein
MRCFYKDEAEWSDSGVDTVSMVGLLSMKHTENLTAFIVPIIITFFGTFYPFRDIQIGSYSFVPSLQLPYVHLNTTMPSRTAS